SPIGLIKGYQKPLENWSETELADFGIQTGTNATIDFESGYRVEGNVENIIRQNGNVVIIGFSDCTAYDPAGVKVYQPDWGTFDMAVGASIVSAYSGSADKVNYNVYPPKSEKKALKVTYSDNQKHLFGLYRQL